MFDDMFTNIGEKIKRLVKFFACVGMILSVLFAVLMVLFGGAVGIIIGPLVGVVLFLLSWISSWLMYGYGEMIQRLISIDNKLNGNRPYGYNKPKSVQVSQVKKVDNDSDKEVLYQFAMEQIEKGQYAFARDALKRIEGYKDSDAILSEITSL